MNRHVNPRRWRRYVWSTAVGLVGMLVVDQHVSWAIQVAAEVGAAPVAEAVAPAVSAAPAPEVPVAPTRPTPLAGPVGPAVLAGPVGPIVPAESSVVQTSLRTNGPCVSAPGLVVRVVRRARSKEVPRVPGQGRVEITAPSGIKLLGAYTCTGRTWTVVVDGGSGRVGGVLLASEWFGGTLSYARGVLQSTVTAELPAGASLLPGWQQLAELKIDVAKRRRDGLVAEVRISATKKASSLVMSGPLLADGSYLLTASGSLKVIKTAVPFGGTFESVGYLHDGVPRARPLWNITASFENAPGGMVPIGGGAGIARGGVSSRSTDESVPTFSALDTPIPTRFTEQATTASSSMSGDVAVSIDGTTYTLAMDLQYDDEDNWQLSADAITGAPWSPPGMENLVVATESFSGTVTSVEGDLTWDLTIAEIEWTNIVTGGVLSTGFTISDVCPLTEHCPSSDGVFVGFTNGSLDLPSPAPDVSLDGAFLADGSWARFDARSPDISYNGITISNTNLAMWKGSRTDSFDADLEMPDLSANANGFGVEFCGNFEVKISGVGTSSSGGCVEWSDEGVVMAQAADNGDIDSGTSDGGVTLGNTTITGYAWTTLDDGATVGLNDVDVELQVGRNELTAAIDIPANVNHDVGAGDSASTIDATGWFTTSGDFSLDAFIPVNMTSSGFVLDSISVHVGYESPTFSLSLGAEATVAISGHHYPLEVYVGLEAGGGTKIIVSLTVKGGVSSQPGGSFDIGSLIPAGDFEPVAASLVDGSFDEKPDKSMLDDGTFETAATAKNLVANPDFEAGIQNNLMPNGDFESGISGNLMPNAGFEDENALINGDFEEGSGYAWTLTSSHKITMLGSTDAPVTAPSPETGAYAITLRNDKNSSATNVGMSQVVPWRPLAGVNYKLSAWVKSPDSDTAKIALYVNQTGTASGCSTQSTYTTTQTFAGIKDWTLVSMVVPGQSCRTGFTVTFDALDAYDNVSLDALTFTIDSANQSVDLPNTTRPTRVDRFDQMPPITKSGGDTRLTGDFGSSALRSDGYQDWWWYNTGSYGYANGDFDVSIDFLFDSSGARDIADFAFWMAGSGFAAKGYMYRLQNSGGDGGFWRVDGNGAMVKLNAAQYAFYEDRWYTLRLTAVGDTVTAKVTDLSNNSVATNWSYTIPAGTPRVGVFGQAWDGAGSSGGHRFDNFTVYSDNTATKVRHDPAGAHSGNKYLALSGTATGWSSLYSTGEQPTQGSIYTYSAWVRSAGANVTGKLFLETAGGTYESASTSFTATSSWQKVAVTLRMANSGHTDVLPGFVDMGLGAEVRVDDTTLQVVPWAVSTPYMQQMVGTDTHGGIGALELTDANNGSTAMYDLPGWPPTGTTLTATMWIKSATPASVQLKLEAMGGTPESAVTDLTTTSDWRQYSVTFRPNINGHSNPRLSVTIKNGSAGKTIIVDDIVMVASPYSSDLDGAVSDLPTNTDWSGTGGFNTRVVSDVSLAHTGVGVLQVTPGYGATRSTSTTVTVSPMIGSTYTASAWVYTQYGSVPGRLSVSAGSNSASVPFTANGSYQLVQVNMPINSSASSMTLTIENSSTTGVGMIIDDVGLQQIGLVAGDPWVYGGGNGGTVSMTVVDDPNNAHGGDHYFEVKANNATALAAVDVPFTPVVGTQYTMSMWVKSPTGQTFTGRVGLFAHGGSTSSDDEVQWVDFTTSGTTWKQVWVTLRITQPGNNTLRVARLDLQTVNVPLHVDDIVTTQVLTWAPWVPNGSSVHELIVNDASRSADGSSYATVNVIGAGGGGIISDVPATVSAGSSFELKGYLRSTTGSTVNGQIGMTYTGISGESQFVQFSAGPDWTLVNFTFVATRSNTVIETLIDVYGSGMLDVDGLVISPLVIVQDDPWLVLPTGATVQAAVRNDPARAHDGSLGVLQVSKTGGDADIYNDMAIAPTVGSAYSGSVWVRSASGTPVNGRFMLWGFGGTSSSEVASIEFTATSEWQLLTVRLPILNAGHTSLRAEVWWYTSGVTLDIDDVQVQQTSWTTFAEGGSVEQQQINDGARAQSGSGYLRLTNRGSSSAGAYLDTPNGVPVGTTQTMKAWVRSTTGAPVQGRLELLAGQWAGTQFTAGADWTLVTVSVTAAGSGSTGLRYQVRNDTMNSSLDIDSVTVGTEPIGTPDGINTPLTNPQTGYNYLWDDAFGIPGAHLWALSAQVSFVNGKPGLGVGATMYLDPAKSSSVLTGTAWLKGDMVLNISRAEPCLSFGFDGTGTGTAIKIGGGVFTASKFQINVAPKGCEVGAYIVPVGATLAFDATFGDATVHFDLEVGRDEQNAPTFYGDMAINNVKLAGTVYNTMQLTIDITSTASSIKYVGDYTTSLGNFHGDFDLSVQQADTLHMSGNVSLSDWQLVGGTLDIQSFNYGLSMDIPLGPDSCANFSGYLNGVASMGGKTNLALTGNLTFECGVLKVLHLQYQYSHKGIATAFMLDYNSRTHVLAGGAFFKFERSTSWKFLGRKYNRHPKIAIGLNFSMNIDQPSSGSLTLGGTVDVSGGSGSLVCTLSGSGSDDTCSISARINVFGGHSFSDTW